MMNVYRIYVTICTVVSLEYLACADKILMNALLGEGSHFLCAAAVGERLVERGHNITFLISNAYAHRASDVKFADLFDFEIFRHPISVEEVHEQFNAFNNRAFQPASAQMLTLVEVIRDGRAADCDALLGDGAVMGRLVQSNFSALIYDIGWECPILIAKKLNIPYIAISAVSSPCTVTQSAGSVASPAFVPAILSGLPNRMNFHLRVQNTLAHIFIYLFGIYFRRPYDILKDKYDIAPEASMHNLFAKSELFLVNSDFAVEFPCAIPPSVIPVGGLTTKPPNLLPTYLEEFVQNSGEDGVIVCTMGTYFTSIPLQVVKDFVNAFSRLPQRIIFQLRKVPPGVTLPPNVMTLPWLPQNDLLGHNKTRAFMYQGGNNGFYEALYNAVPIVVVPIHGDQYDTGAKVASLELGISIDKLTLTEERIYHALREVTTNSSYAQTAQRLSSMFRDRPTTPSEKAAFWIEHVIKHGGYQYQMPFIDLNIIQRSLIDVVLFLVGCVLLALVIVFTCFRCLLKLVRKITRMNVLKQKKD